MSTRSFTNHEKILIGIAASLVFMLHFIINLNGAYGFFRDELYYLACTNNLAWGYVDQPPLSVYLLKLSTLIFGDSLVAVRIVPALCHCIIIWIAAVIVKDLGGNFFAVLLAVICVALSPIHTAMSSYYSMNPIDMLFWAVSVLLVIRIVATEQRSLWIILGVVLGLGLMNKISVLFLGAGLTAGIVITQRKWLLTPWPYVAGAIAFILFLPYVFWNWQHDSAHLEFIREASEGKYSGRSVLDFIKELVLYHGPLTVPLWIAGLVALFFYPPFKKYSILGWLFLVPMIILLVKGTSKGEYLSPGFVIVFAAGAIYIEKKFNTANRLGWYGYPAVISLTAIVMMPMVTPLLPVTLYVKYADAIGMAPTSNENKELAELPQFYADMFGWEEKARDVANVFNSLSDSEQERCAIFSDNYGRCGALDFYGKELGLPKSIGNHNNYWIWGPRGYTGELMIILGGDLEDQQKHFESVTLVSVSKCQYCMPYENNVNIFLCRGLKYPLSSVWPDLKHYD
jgi:hypothetical protein